MKKKRKPLKRNIKKYKRKTKTSLSNNFSSLVFIILLLVSILFIGSRLFNLDIKKNIKIDSAAEAKKISLTNIVPSIVTPTSQIVGEKKNDSPVVQNSFCLNVSVLMYHHIEPIDKAKSEGHAQLTVDSGVFDQQMKYLVDNGYRTISAGDLADALIKHTGIPGKPIIITIDDGYSDNYYYAFPIAKKYNIILNLMIPTGLIGNNGYMTWDNLKEMNGSGLVYMYDHTWSHYSLPIGNDIKDEEEIMTAKKQLEENLGKEVKIFAYPYGSYDLRIINILKKNGFIAAFSTIPSTYQCESDIYTLKRTRIGNSSLPFYGL